MGSSDGRSNTPQQRLQRNADQGPGPDLTAARQRLLDHREQTCTVGGAVDHRGGGRRPGRHLVIEDPGVACSAADPASKPAARMIGSESPASEAGGAQAGGEAGGNPGQISVQR